MFKKITIGFFITVGLLVGYVALQPSDFRIVREIKIQAQADRIFQHVNDLHEFDRWNPWAKLDRNATTVYEGPTAGVGASAAWDGNNEVGKGRMTIVESQPNTLIRMKLDYEKPFRSTNNAEFTFKPEGEQTVISWSLSGRSNFLSKLICTLFMNMDKMVGGMFEKGLADLKKLSEGSGQ